MIISNLWFSILLDDDPKVPLRDLVHWHVNHEAVVEARGDHRHTVAGGAVLRARVSSQARGTTAAFDNSKTNMSSTPIRINSQKLKFQEVI